MKKRLFCEVKNCNNLATSSGRKRKDGTVIYKKLCVSHNKEKYKMSNWKYKSKRKDYCENRDGRLGFKCRYKIRFKGQLHADHKNGNPSDNRTRNIQTLCANCHAYKTWKNKDGVTPGRKYYKHTDKQIGKLLWS